MESGCFPARSEGRPCVSSQGNHWGVPGMKKVDIVKVCRRHLISPAWIRREKEHCQMCWNAWHSDRGEEAPSLREQTDWGGREDKRKRFSTTRTTTQLGENRTYLLPLRTPFEHLDVSFLQVRLKIKTIFSKKLCLTLLGGNYYSFISQCVLCVYYTLLSLYYINLYLSIWCSLTCYSSITFRRVLVLERTWTARRQGIALPIVLIIYEQTPSFESCSMHNRLLNTFLDKWFCLSPRPWRKKPTR